MLSQYAHAIKQST